MADFGTSLLKGLTVGAALGKGMREGQENADERAWYQNEDRKAREKTYKAEWELKNIELLQQNIPEAELNKYNPWKPLAPDPEPTFGDQLKEFFGLGKPVPRPPKYGRGLSDLLGGYGDRSGIGGRGGVSVAPDAAAEGYALPSSAEVVRNLGVLPGGQGLLARNGIGAPGAQAGWQPPEPTPQGLLLAQRYGPESGFSVPQVLASMAVESGFRPGAVSPKEARGLMQLLPATFSEVMPRGNIDNAADNVRAGLAYLAQQRDAFGGDMTRALRAYNAGPGAEQAGKAATYPETQQYVQRYLRALEAYRPYARTNPGLGVAAAGPMMRT